MEGVVADNWSLQDITSLFLEGLRSDVADEIVIADGEHFYNSVSGAVIQTEALFDFLTDIMLRDEILIDDKYTYTWEEDNNPILEVKKSGVLRAFPFLSAPEKLEGPRERVVNYLCSTNSLKAAHQKNVEEWKTSNQVVDDVLSASLWGGAGMCARSFVYEKGYTPHPLRKRLFVNTGFMLPKEDAANQLKTFLNDNRVKVIQKMFGGDALFSSYINIPALPIRIIQEANSADQMMSIALQMRKDFQPLRDWLRVFQNAISSEDMESLIKYRKQLDSVSQYVDKRIGYGTTNKPVTMKAGMGIFKIGFKGDPIGGLKNHFGIRATLNKLIFMGSGKTEIRKYTKFFGEEKSEIGYQIEKAFSDNK